MSCIQVDTTHSRCSTIFDVSWIQEERKEEQQDSWSPMSAKKINIKISKVQQQEGSVSVFTDQDGLRSYYFM